MIIIILIINQFLKKWKFNNYGDIILTVEQFILNNFKNSNDGKDRLHIETINNIINNNGYKLSNRFGIGKYNKMCNINKIKKLVLIL